MVSSYQFIPPFICLMEPLWSFRLLLGRLPCWMNSVNWRNITESSLCQFLDVIQHRYSHSQDTTEARVLHGITLFAKSSWKISSLARKCRGNHVLPPIQLGIETHSKVSQWATLKKISRAYLLQMSLRTPSFSWDTKHDFLCCCNFPQINEFELPTLMFLGCILNIFVVT